MRRTRSNVLVPKQFFFLFVVVVCERLLGQFRFASNKWIPTVSVCFATRFFHPLFVCKYDCTNNVFRSDFTLFNGGFSTTYYIKYIFGAVLFYFCVFHLLNSLWVESELGKLNPMRSGKNGKSYVQINWKYAKWILKTFILSCNFGC